MARKYPHVRSIDPAPGGALGGECCACRQRPEGFVRVAWDHMRGNDEMERACARHMRMAEDQPGRFFAHTITKDMHFRKKGKADG